MVAPCSVIAAPVAAVPSDSGPNATVNVALPPGGIGASAADASTMYCASPTAMFAIVIGAVVVFVIATALGPL